MKLHLPYGLRKSLLACVSCFAAAGTSLSTGTLMVGAAVIVGLTAAPAAWGSITASGGSAENNNSSNVTLTEAGKTYSLNIDAEGGTVTFTGAGTAYLGGWSAT